MRFFILPFAFLPLLEIIGFVTIGGRIGVLNTLLWLAGSTLLGFYLLRTRGLGGLTRARQGRENDIFMFSDLFDDISLLIAALLLIFPGFISDFMAIPFLLAPCRHWMFGFMRDNPDHFARRYTRKTVTIIEGEYKRMEDNNRPDGA